jgi:uncharacterized protein (DUF2345 family)
MHPSATVVRAEPSDPEGSGSRILVERGGEPGPTSRSDPGDLLTTPDGRAVRLTRDGGDDALVITSPQGRVEMEIRFTAEGPVLSFSSAAVHLESPKSVSLSCDDFRVRARGEVDIAAEKTARVEGHGVEVRSRRRDVHLKANDDVRLDGERVLLNC